jgi:hypothetical protein
MATTQNERLYREAIKRAEAPFGKGGLACLGTRLRHAMILAEVTYIIAGQDSEAAGAAMISFAQYATERLSAEEF